MLNVRRRRAGLSRLQSSRSSSSIVGSSSRGSAKGSLSSSETKAKVGVDGGTKWLGIEILAMGIASQNSGMKNAFGKAAGVGAGGRVPSESIHGTSPKKFVGEREKKEVRKAVRFAMMKRKKTIVKKVRCEAKY